jgi:hypothetical protein
MERIRFKLEWRQAAKRNKVSHRVMATCLGLEEKKFANIYYGLVYIPDDLVEKVNEMVIGFLGCDSGFNIGDLRCGICGEPFEPWGADKDMDNQVPICPRCFNMRQAICVRQHKLLLLNGKGSK